MQRIVAVYHTGNGQSKQRTVCAFDGPQPLLAGRRQLGQSATDPLQASGRFKVASGAGGCRGMLITSKSEVERRAVLWLAQTP